MKISSQQYNLLQNYRSLVFNELKSILQWWSMYMPDKENGGFYGEINNENLPIETAPKGIVLNSRILWTFSEAALFFKDESCERLADQAYNYILNYFWDNENGGVYWSVDKEGNPLDTRKQIYGLAFALYGLSSYYLLKKFSSIKEKAQQLIELIEEKSLDKKGNGYFEAFTRDWQWIGDMRLSEKDENNSKTTNTHLHIVEAYANLYTVSPSDYLKERIKNLLQIFDAKIIDTQSGHQKLFFHENWSANDTLISYGHDIESAWLLLQCAEGINDSSLIQTFQEHCIRLVNAASNAWDEQLGGLWYEKELPSNHLIKEKHWWPQAEAMVGFLKAFEITREENYLKKSLDSFLFIQQYLKDKQHGEWFWGIDEKETIMTKEKAGFWKCPYHNSRACWEVIRLIDHLIS